MYWILAALATLYAVAIVAMTVDAIWFYPKRLRKRYNMD